MELTRPTQISAHLAVGESLATKVLYLRGADALAFAEQFAALAARPVAIWLEGDGEAFRQAVAFPVSGVAGDDALLPIPAVAPCLMVELHTGNLVGFRLTDGVIGRFSLSVLLRSIEAILERLPQGIAIWPGIQQSIEMMTRRQVRLINFMLHADAPTFWKNDYPAGQGQMTEALFRGMPPTHGPGRRQAVAALRDIQSAHYCAAVEQFIGCLDAQIVGAVRACGAPTMAQYNTYLRGAANAARNRIQAAQAVPLLGYLLGEQTAGAARLRRLVDDGQPLWPALADTVGVPEEVVRWLRGKTADDIGDAWLRRIPELLVSLAHLPPEKRPQTRDDWTAYTDFAIVLNQPRRRQRHVHWLQEISRIGWLAAREKFEVLQAAPSDLHDIDDLLNEITGAIGGELLPHVARRWRSDRNDDPEWQAMTGAVDTLFFEPGILKQLRTSLRWHQLQLEAVPEDDAQQALDEQPSNLRLDSWPAPLQEPIKLGSLYAHFLTTSTQLQHEGQLMEHCVGNYARQCLFSGSNIVSLRRRDGRPVSTAELRLVKHGKRFGFEVAQHRAQRNGAVPPEAEEALSRLLAHLRSDDMQPRLLHMRAELEKRQDLDEQRERWLADTPLAPYRLRALKAALKLHAGYERFLAAARAAIEGG